MLHSFLSFHSRNQYLVQSTKVLVQPPSGRRKMVRSSYPKGSSIFVVAVVIWLPFPSQAADVAPSPKYEGAVRALIPFISPEAERKNFPRLSFALGDDEETVGAKAFGSANPKP